MLPSIWPAMGILFVATAVKMAGWPKENITVHDETVMGRLRTNHFQPGDVVGISLMAGNIERAMELAREAKNHGATVVVGGHAAAPRAKELLETGLVDAVVATGDMKTILQFFTLLHNGAKEFNLPGVITSSKEIRAPAPYKEKTLKPGQRFSSIIPDLGLYGRDYWEKIWNNYNKAMGLPGSSRNITLPIGWGCPKARGGGSCLYCSIDQVAEIGIPEMEYAKELLSACMRFGINTTFLTMDSALGTMPLLTLLESLPKPIGAFKEGLVIFARAQDLARGTRLIERWKALTEGYLMVNVGLDSADGAMLENLNKGGNSPAEANRMAIRNLAKVPGVLLHCSFIFGSPGETRETCEETIKFIRWAIGILGKKFVQAKSGLFWLEPNAPAGRVFWDYSYAQHLSNLAGKEIAREEWQKEFGKYAEGVLEMPFSCQEAWYRHFTRISIKEALEYDLCVAGIMDKHEGSVHWDGKRRPAFKWP